MCKQHTMRVDKSLSDGYIGWRPWKPLVGLTRDDIKITAGTNWYQLVQYRRKLKNIEEVYIQPLPLLMVC